MNYQIKSDNIELSASMEALAKKKVERLEHRLRDFPDDAKSVRVVLNSAPGGQFCIKIIVVAGGKEYFTDETGFTLEHALVGAVEELDRMLEKNKIGSRSAKAKEWEESREEKRYGLEEELEEEI